MQNQLHTLQKQFRSEIAKIATAQELERLKVKYLGKKGPIQELMKSLREISTEERPKWGKEINALKSLISFELQDKLEKCVIREQTKRLENETLDITLPGRERLIGRKHILTKTLDDMLEILIGMGFSVQLGPDIDTDYYNFEALNFPKDHPAREMQDTFYISEDVLLRTQTSNIQVRVMESSPPPIRIIAPGKVYRNEAITARSHVFFSQVEALYIDKEVTFADLLATLNEFLEKLFQRPVEVRYRPSYFPFVEPGMEVDVNCLSCEGGGCTICKHTGWLEILGAGMVHPEVLKNGCIDPEIYTGYAWGIGVERLAMLKYHITDIRMFTENDMRFLEQFPAV